jgi:tetraacyldisaccharide 4'-kinase
MRNFFEALFFSPRWYHYIVMILLFPLSIIYGIGMGLRRLLTPKQHFSIPIISVGNLIVGGSGKTPFVIALASRYEGVTIISRGYGRQTQGRIEVSSHGKILTSVQASGDEAMLMAKSLPHASVIVCENRVMAIEVAMREGAKIIILDDGFNRIEIEKFEILLEPSCMPNTLAFPAGGLREFYATRHYADIIAKEKRDFKRQVEVLNPTKRMVLVTAISNPERLEAFLPEGIVTKVYYDDHAYFDEIVLNELLEVHKATSLLCTSKDKVKLEEFKLPISEMKLELQINEEILTQVDTYIDLKRNNQ